MPSMDAAVTLPLPKEKAASVVLDPMLIGRAAPDVERVDRISDGKYLWVIVVKVGFVKKTVNLETTVQVHDGMMDFRGESPEIEITGQVSLSPIDDRSCQLLFKADYAGKGALAGVINNVVKSRSASAKLEFQRRVLELLKSQTP